MAIESISPDVSEQELRLACAELERRLRAGEVCAAEEWLARHPVLAGHPNSALELVYTEFVVREQLGQRPAPEDWFARFPQWAEDLRELFQVHQVVGGPSGTPHVRGGDTAPGGPSAAALPLAERRLGDYEVLEELGRGGMGVVYKARHLRLDRLVALKVILAGDYAGPQEHARFRTEAEAAARLQHPNIVAIHEVGEDDGRPFVALEFVPGATLAERLAGTPLPATEAARLVEVLARAMDYAHQRGVVHRDLKPANILLRDEGRGARGEGKTTETEEASSSPAPRPSSLVPVPKITDFGLARKLDVEVGPTRTGAVVGTPGYMAPEQARGDRQPVGPAADVYALGAVLYELLTGRPPFKAATPLDTILQGLSDEPLPPSRLSPKVPRDLETVCLKCLEKEPPKRYATARELADDLGRFLAGEPVRARPAGGLERLAKLVRRRPAAAALVAVSALAALALTGGSLGFAAVFQEERDYARDQEQRARTEKARALRGEADARAATVRALKGEADARAATTKAEEERKKTQRNFLTAQLWRVAANCETDPWLGRAMLQDADACPRELRDFCWGYYERICQRGRQITLPLPPGNSYRGTFVKDGAVVAVREAGGIARLWNTATGRELARVGGPADKVSGIALSADGRVAAFTHFKRKVPYTVASTVLYTNYFEVKVWDTVAGKELYTLPIGESAVWALKFSPDGRFLATSVSRREPNQKKSDYVVQVWDVATGKECAAFPVAQTAPKFLAFNPDGTLLVMGEYVNTGEKGNRPVLVNLWEVATGQTRVRFHTDMVVYSLAFSADGKTLALRGNKGVRLWDVASPTPQAGVRLEGGMDSLALSPDTRYLATHGSGPVLCVWDLSLSTPVKLFSWPAPSPVSGLSFVRGGKTLTWMETNGTVKRFDLDFLPEKVVGNSNNIGEVAALSADGKVLALPRYDKGDEGHRLQLWDTGTCRLLHNLPVHPAHVPTLAFRTDGRAFFSTSWVRREKAVKGDPNIAGLEVTRWDVATGRAQATRLIPADQSFLQPRTAAITPDGKLLACTHGTVRDRAGDPQKWQWENDVRLWAVDTGELLHTLRGHPNGIAHLAFSPDGRSLVTVGWKDETIRLWDVPSGEARLTISGAFPGNQILTSTIAFSTDGELLVTTSKKMALRLWDLRTLQERPAIPCGDAVTGIALTGDAKTLAVREGLVVKLIDVTTGHTRAVLPTRVSTGGVPVAFGGDGRVLVTVDTGGVRLWMVGGEP